MMKNRLITRIQADTVILHLDDDTGPLFVACLRKGRDLQERLEQLEDIALGFRKDGVRVGYILDDLLPYFTNRFGIKGTPTYLIIRNGDILGTLLGKNSGPALVQFIKEAGRRIECRGKTEAVSGGRKSEIGERKRDLEEAKTALKILMKQRDNDREDIEKNLIANIHNSLLPYLAKLKTSGLREDQMRFISEIEQQLEKLGSSFIRDLSSEYLNLSPSEIRVASLIKDGKSSKDIADLVHISLNTVLFHRNNIRRKMGLKNSKTNLMTYLQTFDRGES